MFPATLGNMQGGFEDVPGEQLQGRERARETVERHMISLGWNPTDLARHSGLDIGTVADFIGGTRWPQAATQNKIEKAFQWGPGSIVLLTRGGEPVDVADSKSVVPQTEDEDVLSTLLGSLSKDALKDVSEAESAELIAAARLTVLERLREMRKQ